MGHFLGMGTHTFVRLCFIFCFSVFSIATPLSHSAFAFRRYRTRVFYPCGALIIDLVVTHPFIFASRVSDTVSLLCFGATGIHDEVIAGYSSLTYEHIAILKP